ncbi:MAG: DinB family protein [Bradymonadaceae bacterium]
MTQVVESTALRDHLVLTLETGWKLIATMTEHPYQTGFPDLGLSSIGEHYRHHLDHVELFIEGLEAGCIDYDKRRRDPRVASQVAVALEKTRRLIEALQALPADVLDEPIQVYQRSHVDDPRHLCTSTVARELLFLNSHAIHHYAIMTIATRLHGLKCGETIGVMPSTLVDRPKRSDEPALSQAK